MREEQDKYNDLAYFRKKYPHISFHLYLDKKEKPNLLDQKHYLFASEGYITVPHTYEFNTIKHFKGLITSNSRFYKLYKDEWNIILTHGQADWNNYFALSNREFTRYENKINGVCALNKIYNTGREGDICYLREKVFNSFNGMLKHAYGPVPYGGRFYQGGGGCPSSIDALKIISKYKFCFAFEPMYHPIWSWDWVTERMWNCFRAKTMPIYFGGYNVEKLVPPEFFIDLRKYITQYVPYIEFNYQLLTQDLKKYPKEKYINIVEKAYEWQKTNRLGNIEDIDKLLETLPI